MIQRMLQELADDPLGRLRWRVLREFGVLPGSQLDQELSDADCLYCGLHMALDMGWTPIEMNPNFDPVVFRSRKEETGRGGTGGITG